MAKKAINKKKSFLEFEGYALGGLKSHKGTFNKWEGFLIIENGKITGLEGEINTKSINTRIKLLDKHLKSEDFFEVEKYPKIIFKSTSIREKNGKGFMEGKFTFRGKTDKISAPVTIRKNSIYTEFKVNVKPFKMKYVGIKSRVKIIFKFSI